MKEDVKKQIEAILADIDYWIDFGKTPTRSDIEKVRSALGRLEYLATPKLGWEESPGPTIGAPICSEERCKETQLLYNHAPAGFDPVWYCQQHLKNLEHSHHVPGTEETSETVRLERARTSAKQWTRYLEQMEAEVVRQQTPAEESGR